MIGDALSIVGWATVMAVQLFASVLLHRQFRVLLASQGATALFAAWAFAICWQSQWGVFSIAAAISMGLVVGLAHLLLYWLAGRDVLLVVSVLMSFFANELWVAVPTVTGGSGGLVLFGASVILIPLSLALGLLIVGCNYYLLGRLETVAAPALRRLGLFAGVLGVPAGRIFVGTFMATGAAIGCAGAAAALLANLAHPSLFSPSWSLTILAIVVTPNLNPLFRIICLPIAFVLGRVLLRDLLPVSVGYSQMIEMAFPSALVLWSRLSRDANETHPRDALPVAHSWMQRTR